ncbi:class I SAM-dependent methyltransferase [Streptomyces fuscichromogenes]|uniref:Methyltransferase n=1 Tax=Streptomyces fuscichromogenes TaxID=1324013 RepID=A0A917XP20_9ACTN|nr:class I SAM-dependent methyltransferase [Streptomyces fuscichromogenes]GGN42275.1 methyltransferase [Streptomyces fuscichromogenes]
MPVDARSPKKLRHNRATLTHRSGYALRHPDHVGCHRAVMASDTRRNPEAAVGSRTHEHRMPDIGCGNLRGVERRLGDRLPHLTVSGDLTLDFLPDDHFDVVHAHSVFSHSPLEVIDQWLGHVGRMLTETGFFDFTFDRAEGAEHQVLREDFPYRTETLVALAQQNGLHARFMDDREKRPHGRSGIRVSRSPLPAVR